MDDHPCRHCDEPERLHGLVTQFYSADNPPPLCLGYERKPLITGVL